MPQSDGDRTPQSSELLILADGRRFQIASVERGARGWWFTATAHDGSCMVQGNLPLDWDAECRGWRVADAVTPGPSKDVAVPPSMRRAPAPKRKQLD